MSRLTLAWIEMQIEKALDGGNNPQNVRDFALLCIARDKMREMFIEPSAAPESSPSIHDSSVIFVPPEKNEKNLSSLDDIENAISDLSIYTTKDAQRAKDLKTWAKIMRGQ